MDEFRNSTKCNTKKIMPSIQCSFKKKFSWSPVHCDTHLYVLLWDVRSVSTFFLCWPIMLRMLIIYSALALPLVKALLYVLGY